MSPEIGVSRAVLTGPSLSALQSPVIRPTRPAKLYLPEVTKLTPALLGFLLRFGVYNVGKERKSMGYVFG